MLHDEVILPQQTSLDHEPDAAAAGACPPLPALCHDGQRWRLFRAAGDQIVSCVSSDLWTWQSETTAIPTRPGAPMDGLFVLLAEGRHHLFSAGGGAVHLAVSADQQHWEALGSEPVLASGGKHYRSGVLGDPFVFWNAEERCWWLLFAGQVNRQPVSRSGCIGLAKSSDLRQWHLFPPLWSPKTFACLSGPQLQAGPERPSLPDGRPVPPEPGDRLRWWLLYQQGQLRHRLSNTPVGPFRPGPGGGAGSAMLAGLGRVVRHGQRWISQPLLVGPPATPQADYPLAIPREVTFTAAGCIEDRPAAEMLAAAGHWPGVAGGALAHAQALAGRWFLDDLTSARSTAGDGGTLLLPEMPGDYYLEASLRLYSRDMEVKLLLGTDAELDPGWQLSLQPARKLITLSQLTRGLPGPIMAQQWATLPVKEPLTVRLFLRGPWLEMFVDDRVSVSAFLGQPVRGASAWEAADGKMDISGLRICPLETVA